MTHDQIEFEHAYSRCFPITVQLDQSKFVQDDDGQYSQAVVFTAWALWKAAKADVKIENAAELHFNATRLRNVAHLVGLAGAIPEADILLDGARGTVLGQIAVAIRAAQPIVCDAGYGAQNSYVMTAQPPAPTEAIPTWQERVASDPKDYTERTAMLDEIAALRAAAPRQEAQPAVQADAERYRKIKSDNASCESQTFCLFFDDEHGGLINVDSENMDAEIDAALAAPSPVKQQEAK